MSAIGYCGLCGKPCRYVTLPTRSHWVHTDTGQFRGSDPEPHDCNTHIIKDDSLAHMADHEYDPSDTEPCCRTCGRSPLEHPFPTPKED